MDTTYGVPTNITAPPTAVNISSSTNATPIEITTSAAHNLQTDALVSIDGHTTNTAANGFWRITVTASDKFTLNGSVGVGVGGATGDVVSMDLGGFQIPEDAVDDIDANSVNVGFEALGDRSAFVWAGIWLSVKRKGLTLPDADKTITYRSNTLFVPDVTALRVYTLPSPTLPAPFASMKVRWRFKREAHTGNDARVFYSGDIIATLPGSSSGKSWVDVEADASGTAYDAVAWGGAAIV